MHPRRLCSLYRCFSTTKTRTKINFNAGPSQLSKNVLAQASQAILDYNNSGSSICELSHFNSEWKTLYNDTVKNTINFLNIPKSHKCFYMNGGGTHQFTTLFYNLCNKDSEVQVLVSGYWSQKAADELSKLCKVKIVNHASELKDDKKYSFTFYCENETVNGIEYKNGLSFKPKNHILVCDSCSILGGKHMDIGNYDVLFSSLSKNLGVSGSTLVILKKELLKDTSNKIPDVMNWREYYKLNGPTPSVFSIFFTLKNLKHMIKTGGLDYYDRINTIKSDLLYKYIDNSDGFYINTIDKKYRSRTNIVFTVKDSHELSKYFSDSCDLFGFIGTRHHFSDKSKGCRLSLYNSISIQDVENIIDFMEKFKRFVLYKDLTTHYSNRFIKKTDSILVRKAEDNISELSSDEQIDMLANDIGRLNKL